VLPMLLILCQLNPRLSAIYKGTVNDPTTFPTPNRTHGSHHWAFERLLSAALVPMTAAAFVTSGSAYPVLDGLLGISLVVHSHIGVSYHFFFQTLCSRAG
jgi:succinate dehydrogenase (ubiquinone) membrane anchor subunit